MRQRGNTILETTLHPGSDLSKMSEFGDSPILSKNSNKSHKFATGAYQGLHKPRPRHVVWFWEPDRKHPALSGQALDKDTSWLNTNMNVCNGRPTRPI